MHDILPQSLFLKILAICLSFESNTSCKGSTLANVIITSCRCDVGEARDIRVFVECFSSLWSDHKIAI